MRNIEVERTGAILPGEIVLLGVPYDSVAGSPGANDNALGVAALLELARRRPEDRPVRLVAFLNEESPFLNSREMGSRVYVRRAAPRRAGRKSSIAKWEENTGYSHLKQREIQLFQIETAPPQRR